MVGSLHACRSPETWSVLKPLTIRPKAWILAGSMLRLLVVLLPTIGAVLRSRRGLVIENLALRQQLATLAGRRRPVIRPADRLFWILLRRLWNGWAESLAIVQPDTGRALAPRRLPDLLELALQARGALRPPSPAARGSRPHPENGHRECLGRAPHPRRAPPPWLQRVRAQRLALPALPTSRTEGGPDLEGLPPESPKRHRFSRGSRSCSRLRSCGGPDSTGTPCVERALPPRAGRGRRFKSGQDLVGRSSARSLVAPHRQAQEGNASARERGPEASNEGLPAKSTDHEHWMAGHITHSNSAGHGFTPWHRGSREIRATEDLERF